MGDIDSSNFTSTLVADFARTVESADFVALDLEMSGISFPDRTEGPGDTLPYRYRSVREIARTFGIIQLGLSVFEQNTVKVYNFYTFPRPVTEGEGAVNSVPQLSLCSASMNFNRASGMDFQRWIDKGVTYVNRDVEEKLKKILLHESDEASCEKSWESLVASVNANSDTGFLEELEYIDQERRYLEQVSEFLTHPDLITLKVPFVHGGQKWLKAILAKVHSVHPSLRLVEEVSGGGTSRVLSKQTGNELFSQYVGFREIWKLLTNSARPLVVHNGFLDLMFCYNAFESDLPETLPEFKVELGKIFTNGIYDTRLIALESGLAPRGAALETLVSLFGSSRDITVMDSGKYSSAGMNGTTFHEAGYDALLTGKVFLGLRAKLQDVTIWNYMVCISRSLWVLHIDSSDTDRVLMDCGVTNKSRVVRYLPELPNNCSVRDIVSAFENEIVSTINVQWINDKSAFLVLTWATNGGDVMTTVNAKLMEAAKTVGWKIGTVSEATKSQLDRKR
jgi:poly(A)-specific ribonuclease